MCDRLVHLHAARSAADALLESYLCLPVRKAIDTATPAGFDRAVARLSAELRTASAPTEDQAFRRAVAALDVDWGRTTREQRSALVRRAVQEAGAVLQAGVGPVEAKLAPAARQVLRATRDGARRSGLTVSADFNALDRRMLDYLRTSETGSVRDAFGRRAQALSERARAVVASGLEQGLGRAEIASALERAATDTLKQPSRFYWETVAGAFTGRARSYGQLSSFAEAGITRYRIEAVLDEHTTPTCRFLHGREFTIASALASFREAEERPEDLKVIHPWVRERLDAETGRRQLYVRRGEERVPLAEELRSGLGRRDDVGEFRGLGDPAVLGVIAPPFHGLCRSTLVSAG
jgi:SPP1 gp7 family putative phage head morphogenesis protein